MSVPIAASGGDWEKYFPPVRYVKKQLGRIFHPVATLEEATDNSILSLIFIFDSLNLLLEMRATFTKYYYGDTCLVYRVIVTMVFKWFSNGQ